MPVGGSVAEGVAILRYEALRPLFTCWYEAVEHLGGGVGLPSRVCVRVPLVARAEASRVRVPSTRKG